MKIQKPAAIVLLLALQGLFNPANARDLVWYQPGKPVTVGVDTDTDLVVGTAIDMFGSDINAVTGTPATVSDAAATPTIKLTQLDKATEQQIKGLRRAGVPVERLAGMTDGFNIKVHKGQILVTGTNGRGTAYGLLELSRMAGVSPWIWWGDVTPQHRDKLTLTDRFETTQGASVEYRGVFLNDEDWSLRPWSSVTFEPNNTGTIGPRTNKEIFKLLMRLRANAVWPAMHEGTEAFFKSPDNKLVADSCGIAVGSSHCEPMLRNNVDEWDQKTRGRFNYITNRDEVQRYWAERLDQVKNSAGGNMFTIGMRGIHDGSMEGVSTPQEKFDALQQVINDQQQLLAEHIGDPAAQMQVFVPYKEVLELYEMGLEVPEYVTLMWCDDNYGYITRLNNAQEQQRSGGGGVYYHLSYWGRPHDNLWLTTVQPGLIYSEMSNAYDHNARKLWIANVHDPKVAAYDLQLFLDLAWNIDCVKSGDVGAHLEAWLKTNFGEEAGASLYPVMRKYYELCAKRRPEFMGWSQVELDKKVYHRGLSPAANTDFSFTEFGSEADRYMEEFITLAAAVDSIGTTIAPELGDAYFAAVEYPVKAAANNAIKMLEAQRARQAAAGSSRSEVFLNDAAVNSASARSQQAYLNIRRLTDYYNNQMSGGRWRHSMNMHPRDLPALAAPVLPTLLDDPERAYWLENGIMHASKDYDRSSHVARDAADFTSASGDALTIDMLGHSNRAVQLSKGSSLHYDFTIGKDWASPTLAIAMIPTQPNDNGDIRYSVSIDGGEPMMVSLKEPFRSERWKQNVLRAQALRTLPLPALSAGKHTLTITALDDHIVADQWMIDSRNGRKHYLLPTSSAN